MKRNFVILTAWVVVGVVAGAAEKSGVPTKTPSGSTTKPSLTTSPKPVFTLTSPAFQEGKPIPKVHARQPEGKNISPELKWKHPPKGVKEYALILDDPDAPSPQKPRKEGPWIHWIAAKIPVLWIGLPENAGAAISKDKDGKKKKKEFVEGENDWEHAFYEGPFPPKGSGKHRYVFRLYALDTELKIKRGFSRKDLLKKMKGHVLAEATLMGTYERK
jgi:Raf kinase inhibitor-like YbhB/YbcL family protein